MASWIQIRIRKSGLRLRRRIRSRKKYLRICNSASSTSELPTLTFLVFCFGCAFFCVPGLECGSTSSNLFGSYPDPQQCFAHLVPKSSIRLHWALRWATFDVLLYCSAHVWRGGPLLGLQSVPRHGRQQESFFCQASCFSSKKKS